MGSGVSRYRFTAQCLFWFFILRVFDETVWLLKSNSVVDLVLLMYITLTTRSIDPRTPFLRIDGITVYCPLIVIVFSKTPPTHYPGGEGTPTDGDSDISKNTIFAIDDALFHYSDWSLLFSWRKFLRIRVRAIATADSTIRVRPIRRRSRRTRRYRQYGRRFIGFFVRRNHVNRLRISL